MIAATIAALAISISSYAAGSVCTISVSTNNQHLTAYNIANEVYEGDVTDAQQHYNSTLFNSVAFEAINKDTGVAYTTTVPFGQSAKIEIPCGGEDNDYNVSASLSGTSLVGSSPAFASTFLYVQRVDVNDNHPDASVVPFYDSSYNWRPSGK